MTDLVFVHPGDLNLPTGGYSYDRRIIAGLRALGWAVDVLRLPGAWPMPSDAERSAAALCMDSIADDTIVVVDGLALGAMPEIAAVCGDRLKLVALVHHPLADETGLRPSDAARLHKSEREALGYTRAIVASGHGTARILRDEYAVDPNSITIAEPGVERWGRARCIGNPPLILSVASLIPRKGHDILIHALASVSDLAWECRLVGDESADRAWSEGLKLQAARAGLEDRIHFAGVSTNPRSDYLDADLFALPSRYEGYGMAYAEALVCGLPVIGCPVGALADILPPGAGRLVPVDDVDALATALREVLSDPERRAAMSAAAFAAGSSLPDWDSTVRRISDALRAVR